jgi:pantetheine-phosphate adenylyltransferase
MPRAAERGPGSTRAVYPGTFDPFTPGHVDVVDLAAMNELLGVTTLLVPARPALVTMSSTAVRALRT